MLCFKEEKRREKKERKKERKRKIRKKERKNERSKERKPAVPRPAVPSLNPNYDSRPVIV